MLRLGIAFIPGVACSCVDIPQLQAITASLHNDNDSVASDNEDDTVSQYSFADMRRRGCPSFASTVPYVDESDELLNGQEKNPSIVYEGNSVKVRDISRHNPLNWLENAFRMVTMDYVGNWVTWILAGGPQMTNKALQFEKSGLAYSAMMTTQAVLFLAGELLSRPVAKEEERFNPVDVLGDLCSRLNGYLGDELLKEVDRLTTHRDRYRPETLTITFREVLSRYPWANLHLACPGEMLETRLRKIPLVHYIRRDIFVGEQYYELPVAPFLMVKRAGLFYRTTLEKTTTEHLLDLSEIDAAKLRAGILVKYTDDVARGDGVFRHWFIKMAMGLVKPRSPWFRREGQFVKIHPKLASVINPVYQENYQVRGVLIGIGRIFALSVIESIPLGFQLDHGLTMVLSGRRNGDSDWSQKDLDFEDPVYAANLKYLSNCLIRKDCDETLEGMAFVAPDGTKLIPNGENVPITADNVKEYVRKLRNYVMYGQNANVYKLFKLGFDQLIDTEVTKSVLTPEFFKLVIQGESIISIKDLQENVELSGGYNSHNSIQIKWLWEYLAQSQERRSKFLRFVTGNPIVPLGGVAALGKKLQISKIPYIELSRFPKSHTCFFQLLLPEYPNKRIMESTLDESFSQIELGLD